MNSIFFAMGFIIVAVVLLIGNNQSLMAQIVKGISFLLLLLLHLLPIKQELAPYIIADQNPLFAIPNMIVFIFTLLILCRPVINHVRHRPRGGNLIF